MKKMIIGCVIAAALCRFEGLAAENSPAAFVKESAPKDRQAVAKSPAPPAVNASADDKSADQQGYRIDQPGTITFTRGVQIKGKVEKPQVVIFLPKEKTTYRPISLEHSFMEDLMEPLPFAPLDK